MDGPIRSRLKARFMPHMGNSDPCSAPPMIIGTQLLQLQLNFYGETVKGNLHIAKASSAG